MNPNSGDELSMGVNSVTLVGRAGRDPEVRYFESGSMVANLTMAVNRRSRDDEPDWFNLEIWGKQAQVAADYVKKGSLLGIIGSFKLDRWTDRASGEERSKPCGACGSARTAGIQTGQPGGRWQLWRPGFRRGHPLLILSPRETLAPVLNRTTDPGARCADPTRSHPPVATPPATPSQPWRPGQSRAQRCCSPLREPCRPR